MYSLTLQSSRLKRNLMRFHRAIMSYPHPFFFTMPIIPHYFHAVSHSYRLVKNTVLRKTFQVLRRTLVLFSITRKSPIFFSFTYLFCFFIDFLSLHSLIFLSSVKIFSFQRENQFYKKKRKI